MNDATNAADLPTFCLAQEAVDDLNDAGVVGPVDSVTIYERVDVRGAGWLIAPVVFVERVGRCMHDMGRAIWVFPDDVRAVG